MTGVPRDVFVGVMSGTSLDGITVAATRFFGEEDGALRTELLGQTHRVYADGERARLAQAMEHGTAQAYCRLAFDIGTWSAEAVEQLMRAVPLDRAQIRAVVLHGQTLWHEPPHSTWQLGEPAVITERCGVDVISNLRVRDVAAGGQGAPLVSVADRMLFAHEHQWRVLQNIGGIGNLTVVPPRAVDAPVIAFDTGPGVVIIDGVVRQLFPDTAYDVDGAIARRGQVIASVVTSSLAHAFFETPPPKSTGRELFTSAYIDAFIAACRRDAPACTDADIVATAVALTAESIAQQFDRYVVRGGALPAGMAVHELLLSGGGAENPALVAAIREAVARHAGGDAPDIALFRDRYFDGGAKEAVAFALLGWLFLHGHPGNLPSATGAHGLRPLGNLTVALPRVFSDSA